MVSSFGKKVPHDMFMVDIYLPLYLCCNLLNTHGDERRLKVPHLCNLQSLVRGYKPFLYSVQQSLSDGKKSNDWN
jgi:hypothetical protein